MSSWQKRLGVRLPALDPPASTDNHTRRANYERQNEPFNRRALTPKQAKRIALKRRAETKRNARRRWTRKQTKR